jgi:Fe-Mn family superoxide dismutase
MFSLPQLPYAYDALHPYISAETLQFHYDKHHRTYVNKLNEALQNNPELLSLDIVTLLQRVNELPENLRMAVINNGGQHFNHSLYWEVMGPDTKPTPEGQLLAAIEHDFGSFVEFQNQFTRAGINQFGSGWAWLSLDTNGRLLVEKTLNADNPILHGKTPLLTMDVWEHAYYLDYQNRRPDYIEAWWNVINWEVVEQKFAAAR